jgi:hypothetical protein
LEFNVARSLGDLQAAAVLLHCLIMVANDRHDVADTERRPGLSSLIAPRGEKRRSRPIFSDCRLKRLFFPLRAKPLCFEKKLIAIVCHSFLICGAGSAQQNPFSAAGAGSSKGKERKYEAATTRGEARIGHRRSQSPTVSTRHWPTLQIRDSNEEHVPMETRWASIHQD